MTSPIPALPQGSKVLVTGATGYIATHIIQQLLERGYKVRGTVRNTKAAFWTPEDVFPQYRSDDLELFEVPDISTPGSFDHVVKDMDGIVHVATIAVTSNDTEVVIPATIQAAVNALEAAMKEPNVKRFVFTSTSASQIMVVPGIEAKVDANSWNEVAVKAAYILPPYTPFHPLLVYRASKVLAEKAVWKFVDEKKPGFSVNTVLPITNLGKVINKRQWTTTPGWVKSLWEGKTEDVQHLTALNYIHVDDVAAIHIAALLDPEVNGQRLPVWNKNFNWNDVLSIFREVRPDRNVAGDLDGMEEISIVCDTTKSFDLLQKWADRKAWIPLKIAIEEMVKDLE